MKRMKIQFTKSPTGAYGLAYNAGDMAELEEKQAKELMEKGYAVSPEVMDGEDSDLPEDLPGREVLVAAGVTMDELKQVDDYTVYSGIGAKLAEKLTKYLKPEGDPGGDGEQTGDDGGEQTGENAGED